MDDSAARLGQLIGENILPLTAICMFLLGALAVYLPLNRLLYRARRDSERLSAQLASDAQLHAERIRALEAAEERLQQSFSAASQRALHENNQQFLQLAQESMQRFRAESQADLDQRRQSIHHLVEPIREALKKTEQQIQSIEHDRQRSFGALGEQLRHLSLDQLALRQETNKLVTALRAPNTRGQWGELSLKRLVEMAGMIEHCDFIEQAYTSSSERTIRPDMVIRMPDKRDLVIDAKTPMDAYLDAAQCEIEQERQQHLARYARHMREHVRNLSGKRYWEQFQNAPDFVVLFLPGEQFLGIALEHDKSLMQDALDQRVILATPSTLMALLRAVAFGWQQSILTDNAVHIRDTGIELHRRLAILSTHLEKLGKQLTYSVDSYNSLIGSWERGALPAARRLAELGTQSGRELSSIETLDATPRTRLNGAVEPTSSKLQ
ncbi:DNA recombination protein RmuC [Thiolinea disciformis]|uniref:DNA recombination protein RmuC n=1 Tax=Thiolinea disciformis TaxID=125614 RepID=UPI0003815666|nr:DNA recombination protein RmuC [Thiolinea disciformis]